MNPLFIPLKRQFFNAFRAGTKTEEYRLHGPRWHQGTCTIGRPVVLSLGYGKAHRTHGTITAFRVQHGSTFPLDTRSSLADIYGSIDQDIACITIQIQRTAP